MADIYALPEWTDADTIAHDIFYKDIQSINIYVEDENSEIFYKELFQGFIDPNIKIKKLLPLNGRKNVINYCKDYNEDKPAIFIIDADLDWVRGDEFEELPRLYRHDRYCIENYLFSKDAIIEIIFETIASKTRESIESELSWEEIEQNIEDTLVKLFTEFAIINKFEKSVQTVKQGLKECLGSYNQDEYNICPSKVQNILDKKQLEIIKKSIHKNYSRRCIDYQEIREKTIDNISKLPNKLHIVSGKHFLVPLLFRIMKKHTGNAQITMESFKLRLARHCNKEILEPLKDAIQSTASGTVYNCA